MGGGAKACFPGLRNSLVWLGAEIVSTDTRYMREREIMKAMGGSGRGRRFLSRLGFHSCAAALPLVGKTWSQGELGKLISLRKWTKNPVISLDVIQTKTEMKRQGDTGGERQGRRGQSPYT